jgi:hypothetical protein
MLSIPVTELGRVHPSSIIVDYHRSKYDFVATVFVDIGNRNAVVPLTSPRILAAIESDFVAVEKPTLSNLSVAKVPNSDDRSCVVTARHHNARLPTIQERYRCEKSIHSIAVVIAPNLSLLFARRVVVVRGTPWKVSHGV